MITSSIVAQLSQSGHQHNGNKDACWTCRFLHLSFFLAFLANNGKLAPADMHVMLHVCCGRWRHRRHGAEVGTQPQQSAAMTNATSAVGAPSSSNSGPSSYDEDTQSEAAEGVSDKQEGLRYRPHTTANGASKSVNA